MTLIISLLNTDTCPCPGTHRAACLEFINGFTEFGFVTKESRSLNECADVTILVLSSHKIDLEYLNLLNSLNPNTIYILWYYHSVYYDIPFKHFILTGEHFIHPPKMASHINFHNLNESINNFVPLYLRANESPKNIGIYHRQKEYNACFIGTPYKESWSDVCDKVFYHDINKYGLLSSEQRKENYLKSTIVFGFHNDGNILNSHVTQRVFEGLTYGCIVISDNKAAYDYTNGIVEYVSTKEELSEKVNYILNNPDIIADKQKLGYEWAKKYGTNRYSAKAFLDKIKELWNINYLNTW